MKFSRRHFLKAAGTGGPAALALSTAGTSGADAQTPPSPLAVPAPMTKETGTFTSMAGFTARSTKRGRRSGK